MSCAIFESFKTFEEAERYADELIFQFGKDRVFIFNEPLLYPEQPYTVNVD